MILATAAWQDQKNQSLRRTVGFVWQKKPGVSQILRPCGFHLVPQTAIRRSLPIDPVTEAFVQILRIAPIISWPGVTVGIVAVSIVGVPPIGESVLVMIVATIIAMIVIAVIRSDSASFEY